MFNKNEIGDLFAWTDTITHESDVSIKALLKHVERYYYTLDERDSVQRTLRNLIVQFSKTFKEYYKAGITILEQEPDLHKARRYRQQLITRIVQEWQVIQRLVGDGYAFPKDSSHTKLLRRVIHRAWNDLKLPETEALAIVPSVSEQFELMHFTYAPGIRVLGIPVDSIEAPWMWSIIWHEMASIMIAIYGDELLAEIDEDLYATVPEHVWWDWINDGTDITLYTEYTVQGNTETDTTWNILQDEFNIPADEIQALYPHIQKLSDDIISVSKIKAGDVLKVPRLSKAGNIDVFLKIRRNWMIELIEDSVSVLCLGEVIAGDLWRILGAHYDDMNKGEERHPPPSLRTAVALCIARIMETDGNDVLEDISTDKIIKTMPETVQSLVADEYVQKVARAIYDNRSKFIDDNRNIKQADRDAIETMYGHLANKTVDDFGQTMEAYRVIPAIIKAVWDPNLTAESQLLNLADTSELWKLLENNMTKHPPPYQIAKRSVREILESFFHERLDEAEDLDSDDFEKRFTWLLEWLFTSSDPNAHAQGCQTQRLRGKYITHSWMDASGNLQTGYQRSWVFGRGNNIDISGSFRQGFTSTGVSVMIRCF